MGTRLASRYLQLVVFVCLAPAGLIAGNCFAQNANANNLVELTVLDEQGQPAGNADLEIKYRIRNVDRQLIARAGTNKQGQVNLQLDAGEITSLTVQCELDGHVPHMVARDIWSGDLEFPFRHKLELNLGAPVRGRVVDDQGEPIAGATIRVSSLAQDVPNPNWNIERFDYGLETSDHDGYFSMVHLPVGKEKGIRFIVDHPDYLGPALANVYSRERDPHPFSGVIRLPTGASITGQVTDAAGQPVGEAVVRLGNHVGGSDVPTARSGVDGRFRLTGCWPGTSALTVQARGHAPQTIEIESAIGQVTEQDFQLQPSHTLTGTVIDRSGKPVAGAVVRIHGWQGRDVLDWQTKTDAQGRFQWNDAPAEPVTLDVFADDLLAGLNHQLTPDQENGPVKLWPIIEVWGSVFDTDGKPVAKKITIVWGTLGPDASFKWQGSRIFDPATGQGYRVRFTELPEPLYFRVLADGYSPEQFGPVALNAGSVMRDVRLRPGVAQFYEQQWLMIEDKIDEMLFSMSEAAAFGGLHDLGAKIEIREKPDRLFRVKLVDQFEIAGARHGVPEITGNPERKTWQGGLDDLSLLNDLENVELILDGLEIDEVALASLGKLKTVSILDMTCIWRLQSDGFSALDQLEHVHTLRIDNRWQKFPQSALEAISRLPQLEGLIFGGSGANDMTAKKLADVLPQFRNLKVLRTSDMAIDANLVHELNQLNALEDLSLGNWLDDEIVKQMDPNPNLRRLHLNSRNFTDFGLAEVIRRFPNLEELGMFRTGVTERGIRLLAQRGLPKLKSLEIDEVPRPAVVDVQLTHRDCDIYLLYVLPTGSMSARFRLTEAEKRPAASDDR